MAYDAKTQRLISLKKLSGKAHTSNDKDLANEALPSGLTLASNTIFGEPITSSPVGNSLYDITGQVEYIRFQVDFIAGSDTVNGRHGFELKLPADYEASSSNSKAGTYPYINNQVVNITSGSLQLIPPSFATSYEAKPYYGGDATKNSGTRIPILDESDWYLDYFNGIFFQQDPPGTGDDPENPDFVEAYLYIGKYLNEVVEEGGGGGPGDSNAQYLVTQQTGSLPNARLLATGSGISTSDDFSIDGTYRIQTDPRMSVYTVTASHPTLSELIIPGVDFTTNNRDFHKTQIFLNGVLMVSGSSFDYELSNIATGSLSFEMELKADDIIIVRQS